MAGRHQRNQELLRVFRAELEQLRQANQLFTEQVRQLQTDSAELLAQNEALRSENATLREQVRELTIRLQQNSSNSSKPPSSDPPQVREQRASPPSSGRKPGGQRGHRGTTRRLLPPDRTVPCRPETCLHCGEGLTDHGPRDPAARVHQVVELPPVKLQITHYQRQGRHCACCGKVTWGALPPGVPEREMGPALQAFCALLTGRHRLSRRQGQELLTDLFGWSPAVGTLMALERATAAALRVPVEQVAKRVAAAPVVNADETGWREGKQRPTLWALVTSQGILFRIGDRSRGTLKELLPEPEGRHLVSDRYVVYDGVPVRLRGLCWAHLKRNFAALAERGSLAATVGHWALDEIQKLFRHWRRFEQGEISRFALQEEMVSVQDAFRALLHHGAEGSCAKTAGLCAHLLERWEALWTFTRVEGVQPTNNAAERALRAAVLWRKGSFGHRSESGKHFVERMLTVVATLRLQGRAVLPFLTAACRASITGEPPPDLACASSSPP